MNQLLATLRRSVIRWSSDESAVTSIEYGLLAAVIAVACIGAFQTMGRSLLLLYEDWIGKVIAVIGAAL